MLRSTRWLVFLTLLFPAGGFGAGGHGPQLTAQQQLGRRLYEQSCGICHVRPTLVAGMYGPELSKINMGGNADVLRHIITNGTERMPAFKYQFTAKQIDAIVSYIRILPPGHQDSPAAPPAKAQ